MKIGVFGPGVGALTITAHLIRELPGVSLVHLADTVNNPYGAKSPDLLRKFVSGAINYLYRAGCDVVIIGCNTSSTTSFVVPKRARDLVVLDVVSATLKGLSQIKNIKRLVILGTPNTVSSGVYRLGIRKFAPFLKIDQLALDGLAAMIDRFESEEACRELILQYLQKLETFAQSQAALLACTHFPFVAKVIGEAFNSIFKQEITILSQANFVVEELRTKLYLNESQSHIGTKIEIHTTYAQDQFMHRVRRILPNLQYNLIENMRIFESAGATG